MLDIVVLITTRHRAEKAVIRLLKKGPWMSRFMSGDHWKIEVKTQWADVERHFQVRCGYCHGFHPNEMLVQISECLMLQGAGVNNAGHGRMLVRQLHDTRVTRGWVYEPFLLVGGNWLRLCLVVLAAQSFLGTVGIVEQSLKRRSSDSSES